MKIVKRILQVIGVIIGICVLYLLIVALVPGFSVPEQPLEKGKLLSKGVALKWSWSRKDVSFKVKGTSLSAWLYLPANLSAPVLLQVCDHDSIVPKSAAEETEKNLGKYAEVKYYPIGHFDISIGDNFEKSVSDQLEFLKNSFDMLVIGPIFLPLGGGHKSRERAFFEFYETAKIVYVRI